MERSLVHGVFNTTADVLAAFKARCLAKGVDFNKFSWVGPEEAPEFDPNDHETVVVLDATLNTLENTGKFACKWFVDGQERSWCWEGMIWDSKHLRLLSDKRSVHADGDGPDFVPWTLRWVRIKLDTNVGQRPMDVCDPESSPGCALLFMGAQHPERIKATDYKTRFGFWIPGLKCSSPLDPGKWMVLLILVGDQDREVRIVSRGKSHANPDLAIPSYRK